MQTEIITLKGDITKLRVDAIVNAANTTLLGGGGVDGAIHRAAGPELYEEAKTLGGCKVGEAKITKGYKLPAKYIIHTVGPIYGQENGREAELLASCYKNSLKLALKYNIKTIAFPNISTGAFGYPIEEAAKIAIEAVKEFLGESENRIAKVYLVSHSDLDLKVYENIIAGRENTIENL
jgi:O-acetyl-ADP-ribose deacetylase